MRQHDRLKNVQSNRANRGEDTCHLENEDLLATVNLLLHCRIHLASINVMSRILCHWLSAQSHALINTAWRHSRFFPVWQSDYDCSVKWRMCDHCAATNPLCGRWWGFEQTHLLRGTNKWQQCWLIRKQDRQKNWKAVPGVLPLAKGAGHMLYKLIVLSHSLLMTPFLRRQSNQNNLNQSGVCLQFSKWGEKKSNGDIQVSACASFPF